MSPANLLRAYSDAMHECVHPDKVADHDIRFWRRRGIDQPVAARTIMAAHYDRCASRGSPADCDSALAQAIKEIGA